MIVFKPKSDVSSHYGFTIEYTFVQGMILSYSSTQNIQSDTTNYFNFMLGTGYYHFGTTYYRLDIDIG